jgi:alkylation response protein AidB-like acyl-CoA dehydrogenase
VGGRPAGLSRAALPALDQTRQLARLEFAGVTGRLIGSPGDGAAALDRALDVAAVALAAEQLGGAQRALDMAVEYAKIRRQFDRPIGSFQAIKHRCADLLLEVESLRSAERSWSNGCGAYTRPPCALIRATTSATGSAYGTGSVRKRPMTSPSGVLISSPTMIRTPGSGRPR